ncbi:hypothetical protein ROHU_026919 [Labeo rohita]|uniref:Uncharacterized protein n=1 Tax=Labeo rohita TaxID=84645 RepID=A0A498M8T5_LABRO|nr:hypothetical protein ROHU_026919 [Labeo rohita]
MCISCAVVFSVRVPVCSRVVCWRVSLRVSPTDSVCVIVRVNLCVPVCVCFAWCLGSGVVSVACAVYVRVCCVCALYVRVCCVCVRCMCECVACECVVCCVRVRVSVRVLYVRVCCVRVRGCESVCACACVVKVVCVVYVRVCE